MLIDNKNYTVFRIKGTSILGDNEVLATYKTKEEAHKVLVKISEAILEGKTFELPEGVNYEQIQS